MQAEEFAVFISAAAAALSKQLSDEELAAAATLFSQLGDTLATIGAQRACLTSGSTEPPQVLPEVK
ncbi:MAG: hypothetical protein PHU79_07315 [Oscillospiraceae bacterium]|nr:hypothetical protein [Oscillospiraceae bacterium]